MRVNEGHVCGYVISKAVTHYAFCICATPSDLDLGSVVIGDGSVGIRSASEGSSWKAVKINVPPKVRKSQGRGLVLEIPFKPLSSYPCG